MSRKKALFSGAIIGVILLSLFGGMLGANIFAPQFDDSALAAGRNGIDGKDGLDGQDGAPGRDGADGAPGALGPRGLQGVQGDLGPVGPQGPEGAVGPRGEVGEQGPRGEQGISGLIGPVGPMGAQGEKGDPGIPGVDGRDGTDGKDGVDGRDGIDGINGLQGAPGIQGAQGDPGPQGPQGDPGPQGVQGAPGKDGLDGVDGRDGSDGVDGKDALQTEVVVLTAADLGLHYEPTLFTHDFRNSSAIFDDLSSGLWRLTAELDYAATGAGANGMCTMDKEGTTRDFRYFLESTSGLTTWTTSTIFSTNVRYSGAPSTGIEFECTVFGNHDFDVEAMIIYAQRIAD